MGFLCLSSFINVQAQQVFTETTSVTGFQAFESNSRPINSGVFRTYGIRIDT